MTQLLDPSGPYACVWDESIDGCELPEPEPLINVSRQELLEFVFGKHQPECDLSCVEPAVIPVPAGGVLLGSVLVIAMIWHGVKKWLTM